jgi:hypothetical protein
VTDDVMTTERPGGATVQGPCSDVMEALERRVLWLSTAIVDHANRRSGGSVRTSIRVRGRG